VCSQLFELRCYCHIGGIFVWGDRCHQKAKMHPYSVW
jgi:hypothetical protein